MSGFPRQAASSGAMTWLGDVVLGAATPTITFQNIAQTYRHLRLILMGRSDRVLDRDTVQMRFNNDATAIYDTEVFEAFAAVPTSSGGGAATSAILGVIAASTAPANAAGSLDVVIPSYRDTVFHKTLIATAGHSRSDLAAGQADYLTYGRWRSTVAVNRLDVFLAAGNNFVAGTAASLYGIAGS